MKNIITITIILVAVGLVVYMLISFGGGSAIKSGLTVKSSTSNGSTDSLSRELLQALSSLEELKLDDKLFKDKVFLSLSLG